MLRNFFLTACLLVLAGSFNAQAADIFSDNFNSENGGVGVLDYNSFSNWTVSNGTVDLIGNSYFDLYPGNGLYVDLDGSTSQAGTLSSSALNLNPGTYTLSFDLGGSQRGDTNIVDVSLGSLYNESFTLNSSDPLGDITRTINVGSATSTDLTFHNEGGDNIGAILDNVDLSTSAVPEPPTLLLFAFAVGIFVVFNVFRRRLI